MLASMYPSSAIAYLQTGFRCPEIYTICAVALLDIGSKPTRFHLDLFFVITAGVVSVGLVIWILVAGSNASRRYFENKDMRMQSIDEIERQPLIGKTEHRSNDATDNSSNFSRGSKGEYRHLHNSLSSAEAQFVVGFGEEVGDFDVDDSNEVPVDAEVSSVGIASANTIGASGNRISSRSSNIVTSKNIEASEQTKHEKSLYRGNSDDTSGVPENSQSETNSKASKISPSRARQHVSVYTRPMARAKMILRAVEDATMKSGVYYSIWPLCLALVITIWCSIFQASFFAYVDSAEGRDIEQILYFVRLFSDLLGRPFTRIFRPWFLKVSHPTHSSPAYVFLINYEIY